MHLIPRKVRKDYRVTGARLAFSAFGNWYVMGRTNEIFNLIYIIVKRSRRSEGLTCNNYFGSSHKDAVLYAQGP